MLVLLIGYTKTPEAINNAFRQIIMNLAGGIGFLVALFAIALTMGTLSLVEFIASGVMAPALAALPAVALAFAGITKAAQVPFHTWLLGAMVAPTPPPRSCIHPPWSRPACSCSSSSRRSSSSAPWRRS